MERQRNHRCLHARIFQRPGRGASGHTTTIAVCHSRAAARCRQGHAGRGVWAARAPAGAPSWQRSLSPRGCAAASPLALRSRASGSVGMSRGISRPIFLSGTQPPAPLSGFARADGSASSGGTPTPRHSEGRCVGVPAAMPPDAPAAPLGRTLSGGLDVPGFRCASPWAFSSPAVGGPTAATPNAKLQSIPTGWAIIAVGGRPWSGRRPFPGQATHGYRRIEGAPWKGARGVDRSPAPANDLRRRSARLAQGRGQTAPPPYDSK